MQHWSPQKLGIASSIIAALLWSTGGLGIKLVDDSPATILFYRSLFAGIVFLLVYRKKALQLNQYSLVGSLLYFGLLYTFVNATKLTTAANAIFLQYTAPMIILLLEPKILGTQFDRRDGWTVFFCLIGLGIFLLEDFTLEGHFLGIVYSLISGVILAFFLLIQKANRSEHAESSIFIGNIWVISLMSTTANFEAIFSWFNFGILAWLGIFQIALGYIFFIYGQRRLKAIESSIIAFLEPMLNPIWVVIGYGEKPGKYALIGGAILILTLMIRTLQGKKIYSARLMAPRIRLRKKKKLP